MVALHLSVNVKGKDSMSMFRGFIAVDIIPTDDIIKFLNEINSLNADIKIVEPKNIHITLKFLGDTPEEEIEQIEEIIKNSVKGIDPFNIMLEGTGVFPNKGYIRVVWIGLKGLQYLVDIAKNVDEKIASLGFKKEKRDFSAHLTIGRVKSSKNKDVLLKKIEEYTDFNFGIQEVKSIKLKKSVLTPKGPIYTTLKEVVL